MPRLQPLRRLEAVERELSDLRDLVTRLRMIVDSMQK
jgi:hypothetical protein